MGFSNAEIAKSLVVTETTVKTHVAAILSKLGPRNPVQVVVFAYESGLVHAREGWSGQCSPTISSGRHEVDPSVKARWRGPPA